MNFGGFDVDIEISDNDYEEFMNENPSIKETYDEENEPYDELINDPDFIDFIWQKNYDYIEEYIEDNYYAEDDYKIRGLNRKDFY